LGRLAEKCEHGSPARSRCVTCNQKRSQKYYKANTKKYRDRYQADKDALIIYQQNHRARALGAPGTLTLEDWLVKKGAGCAYCGSKQYRLEIDHRIPLSRGGSNEPENIQAACQFCNRAKHDLDEAEFLEWLQAIQLLEERRAAPRLRISFRWEPPRRYPVGTTPTISSPGVTAVEVEKEGTAAVTRSRRKTPISGIAANDSHSSEKWDKQKANRKLRHHIKAAIQAGAEVLPVLREVSNVWGMYKDGKHWWGADNPKVFRK
jgi:5-methylcytosine-specific restriction endonuclease McrA